MKQILNPRRLVLKKILSHFVAGIAGLTSLNIYIPKVFASTGKFYGFRTWQSPDKTRVVADFSSQVQYSSFILKNPLRVVFDVRNSKPIKAFKPSIQSDPRIKEIRSGIFNNQFRIVIELKKSSKIKSFVLKPQGRYTYRLVIDIFGLNPSKKTGTKNKIRQRIKKTDVSIKKDTQVSLQQKLKEKSHFLVLIDPGHGGEDPGTIGRKYHTYEKDVVLDIAKKLANQINSQAKMKAYLTRNGDYYISLRKRIEKAKKYRADLFISIHADAALSRRAKGSSVYILSTKGATGEFERMLAKRENAADFIGGVASAYQDLTELLLSVVQNDTIDKSRQLAKSIINRLAKYRKPHSKIVKSAAFVVLKSPNIPSVLVETAFLSNSVDEKFLRRSRNRGKIASLIYKGVKDYLNV